MKSIISFLLLIAIGLFASCNRSGSVAINTEVQIPDSIAPFLGLFYGMDKDAQGNYVDSILDTIPGLQKFEKSAMWSYRSDSVKYLASMGLYIDGRFPSEQIKEQMLSLADSLLRFEDADTTQLFNLPRFSISNESASVQTFLTTWSKTFDETSKIRHNASDSTFMRVSDLRWCVVIHKIYEDEKFATFLAGMSFDIHGSCGCPSQSSYLTFNKQTGKKLTISDVMVKYDKKELKHILYKSYCSQSMARENGYVNGEILISESDGVAKIGDYYLFFYHPYKIGCGAEGQYNLFVPRPQN